MEKVIIMNRIIIFIITLILINNMTYSQPANLSASAGNIPAYDETKTLTVIDDFEKNGTMETFSAEIIKKLGRNTYWIKKGELLGSDDNVILELGLYLKNNGHNVLNQEPAVNGYIIELVSSNQRWQNLIIWLANEKGQKNSDYIMMEFDRNFPMMY